MRDPTRAVQFLILLAAGVTAGLLTVKPWVDVGERFIGHADQANLAMVARNIAEGRGAVVDAVWLIKGGGLPGAANVTHPEPYWSIYVAAWYALFFRIFGPSFQTMMLASWVVFLTTGLLAARWAERLAGNRWAGIGAGVFLLLHPAMTATFNGLSDIYVSCITLLAAGSLAFAAERPSARRFFLSGLCLGLSLGIKPTGLLLFGAAAGTVLVVQRRAVLVRGIGWGVLGVAVGLLPLARHNVSGFGQLSAPGTAIVRQGAAEEWLRGSHSEGYFDPVPLQLSDGDRRRLRYERRAGQLGNFLRKAARGDVLPLSLVPFLLLGGALSVGEWRRSTREGDGRLPFLCFAWLVLLAGVAMGAVVHFEARYWSFMIPLATVIAAWAMATIRPWLPPLVLGVAVFLALQGHHWPDPVPLPNAYRRAEAVIPRDAVVLTPSPWEFAYHTRRRAVMLPVNGRPEVLREVARTYRAEYVAIVRRNARHPVFRQLQDGVFPPHIEKVHYDSRLAVGRLRFGEPEGTTPAAVERPASRRLQGNPP